MQDVSLNITGNSVFVFLCHLFYEAEVTCMVRHQVEKANTCHLLLTQCMCLTFALGWTDLQMGQKKKYPVEEVVKEKVSLFLGVSVTCLFL